jgi:hypothetical protein
MVQIRVGLRFHVDVSAQWARKRVSLPNKYFVNPNGVLTLWHAKQMKRLKLDFKL